MTRNRTILALVAILAIGAGGYLAYDNVLRGDAVAPFSLPSTAPTSVASSVPSAAGVTKAIQIPAQAQIVNGQIAVTGSISFALADFQIQTPNVGGFIVSIADQGALEFLVVFAKG